MKNVVLDKNFLQGCSKQTILNLMSKHRFLMSEALFYELLTTDEKSRRNCFVKLVDLENPVAFILRGQVLAQYELRQLAPTCLPSASVEKVRFKFNVGLLDGEFALTLEHSQALLEEIDVVESRVDDMIERARSVVVLYPGLFQGSDSERRQRRDQIELEVSSRTGLSEQVCDLFGLDQETIKLDSAWAVYRYLQTQLLIAIDIAVRNHKQLTEPLDSKIRLGIEHDLHDADFLMLAALEGCAATREKKLRRMLKLLRSDIEILE